MSERIWRARPPVDTSHLPRHLHPVVRRVYAARGMRVQQEADLRLQHLLRPDTLSHLESAARLVADSLSAGHRIAIAGDFDADGATASAVCVRGLKALGAAQVQAFVPDRFRFGYGLSPALVAEMADYAPQLLITVDNGISSHAGVEAAKQAGMRVVVTDHHLAPETLPAADAIVNPNQPGDQFASKALCGVGVAFYLLSAVRRVLSERREQELPKLAQFLDLVALGTVADVVTLDHNNRILIEQGLRRIRAGRAAPGILALLDLAGRDYTRATAQDLAFAVAPRLNAAGRLDDMSVGIRCLLADDPMEARGLAAQLDALNRERRQIQDSMHADALDDLASLTVDSPQVGLVVTRPDWHEGVVGLVASKVKEARHRPVVAFAPSAADAGMLKGSARSIPGFHMRDALAEIDAATPDLIDKFGGHAMAAGLSLPEAALDAFSQAFDAVARRHLSEEQLADVWLTDGELADSELTLETATALEAAGPWGQGFEAPLFEGRFRLMDQRVVGERHVKLRLAGTSGVEIGGIAFNTEPQPGDAVEVLYRLEANEFRGYINPQLVIEDWRPA
ncbi:single-stranded-DNA-specific exonuclease RecJ [Abyssibacter profundi]|uniref:Single-stranded-DNA-specific exonuclease RecJ n=1 Tax=Abyssibacter profundi TaxID=2182787 RepID=A0A363UPJ1_9GAMM|nr:single-stranded-DNA-specific exonuclease RecJ [Abyssibacter profundi]PWN57390.1 single-stranded-DNA-specific exonuclease RecJ [Abyssibacter profundi]